MVDDRSRDDIADVLCIGASHGLEGNPNTLPNFVEDRPACITAMLVTICPSWILLGTRGTMDALVPR